MDNLFAIKERGSRLLITRQHPAVWDELEASGVYRMKREYLEQKNDPGPMTEYYARLYRWYTRQAARYISVPEGAEYPVWLSVSEESMLQPVENSVILVAEIPEEHYLLCNFEAWGYVVNYWYVPLDAGDEESHRQELKRNGLKSDDELFLTNKGNFYPLLKRKVQQSWDRIFTLVPRNMITDIVATAWELRKEWIREVRRYGSD